MFKQRFPFFSTKQAELAKERGYYLDNAATTQRLDSVLKAMEEYSINANASVHRGSYASAKAATHLYESARTEVQQLISANRAEEIVFTSGATESINMIANGLTKSNWDGDKILLMASEHHANLLPWQAFARQNELSIEVIDIQDNGVFSSVQLQALLANLNESIALLAMAHVSNALGNIYPIREVIAKANKYNIRTVIDGTQAVAHRVVDVRELNCDFYVFSGHKMYGPTGTGVLYGKYERLEALSPSKLGGEMAIDVDYGSAQFQAPPLKFEGGTPNIAGVIGLGEAALFLKQNLSHIERKESELKEALLSGLLSLEGVTLLGNVSIEEGYKESIATISMTFEHSDINDVAHYLTKSGIAVRVGHHCAMPLMKRLQLKGTLRVSLACYNEISDIHFLLKQLSMALSINQLSKKQSQRNSEQISEETAAPKYPEEKEPLLPLAAKVANARGWDNIYRQLLLLSKQLNVLPYEERTPETAIDGCESELWLSRQAERYEAYSQSKIIRGILAVLFEKADTLIDSKKQQEFNYHNYLDELGVSQYFSQGRRDGIANAISEILKH